MNQRLLNTDFGDARVFTAGVPHTIVDRAHGVKTPIVGRIIAASPITKQDMTVAFRVVLIDKKDEYSVHTQYFNKYQIDNPDVSESTLEQGDYYQPAELAEATKRFAERTLSFAGTIGSIYRNPPAVAV
jgi:hypothetical protein